MNNQFTPTTIGKRIDILDIIRGLAVFGILLSNILIISGFYVSTFSVLDTMHLPQLNNILYIFSIHSIIGKGYPIFCMLFGVSFYMQYLKYKDKEKSFTKFYLWRMLLLFAIGIMHVFIWPGDVIHYYALLSIFLIPFRRIKAKMMLVIAILLLLTSMGIGLSDTYFAETESTQKTEAVSGLQFDGVEFFDLKDKIQNEGFSGMWYFNKQQYHKLYSFDRLKTIILNIIALFFIGMFLFAKDLITNKMYHWKYLVSFLILGLIGKVLMFYVDFNFRIIENIFMTLFFISLLGIIFKTRVGKQLLAFLKPVGKMALTNYILQSMLAIFVFYGVGLGLFAEIPFYGIYLIALGILAFQTIFSYYWLSHFRFGPMEWFWRTLTYNKNFTLKNRH